ncbi:MAG: C39 family peptidase [Verrucomicrobiales bacterium]
MKARLSLLVALSLLGAVPSLHAIPQEFISGGGGGFGPVIPNNPIFNGGDFTGGFLDEDNWEKGELPGDWLDEPSLDGEQMRRLKSVPYLFGQIPLGVFSRTKNGKLVGAAIVYLDAGAYFGYRPSASPGDDAGLLPDAEAEAREEKAKDDLRQKQRDFDRLYKKLEKDLEKEISRACGRGKARQLGKTGFLRADVTEFRQGDLVVRFQPNEGHSIWVTIQPESEAKDDFVDPKIAKMDRREAAAFYAERAKEMAGGDVEIEGVPTFRQGLRPYCGISTLAMVMRYLGLELGTDGLAAGARLKNTGSAKGSKIFDLYRAAPQEVGAEMQHTQKFDFDRTMRSVAAGIPVIVWRKFDPRRDALHQSGNLPEPTREDEATWPGKAAPNHASVITGFNAERKEVIFMESWGEHTRGRRMRAEEMEGTAYVTFFFKPN